MRLTDSGLFNSYAFRFSKINADLERALQQLADGKKVLRSSDDPNGARTTMELRARVVRIEGYERSAETARFDLATIETVMGEAFERLTRARNLAFQGASTVNLTNGDILADEIDAIRLQLIDLANTSQRGRFLFSGTEILSEPFDTAGNYAGNDNEVQIPIDSTQLVGSTVSGREIFLNSGDVFRLLSDVSTALRARDNDAVSALLPNLEQKLDHLAQVRGQIGVRLSTIDSTLERHTTEHQNLLGRISDIEDIDIERTILELSNANASYDALAATASRVLGRSLFDFLG